MKATVLYSAAALLALACSRPDNDLFGTDAPSGDDAGTSGRGATTVAGSSSAAGSSNPGAGGKGGSSSESTGGSAAAAGVAAGGSAGTAGGADTPGAAGESDGSAGTAGSPEPPKPPEPMCGNGIIETGEQCDDAGHAGQDGCDDDCLVVCSHHGSGTIESEDHHCYNGWDEADFAGAKADCVKRGGHLATISSAAENKLVLKLVGSSKLLGGIEDVPLMTAGTGTYAWLTQEPFTYTNWASQEPDSAEERCGSGSGPGPGIGMRCYEHCLAMNGDGTWEDHRCDLPDGYVCEWEPPSAK